MMGWSSVWLELAEDWGEWWRRGRGFRHNDMPTHAYTVYQERERRRGGES